MGRLASIGLLLQVTAGLTIRSAPVRTILDMETYRASDGRVIIPSSSIKGALRHAACHAAQRLGLTCCGAKAPDIMIQRHSLLASRQLGLCYRGDEGTAIPLCHVCALFGSTQYMSPLTLEDAEPVDIVNTVQLPGIEIDDYTGTVASGKLYFREAVVPGTLFTARIHVDLDRLDALYRPGPKGCNGGEAIAPGEKCWWLELLAEALRLLEAIGIGAGSARAWIISVEVNERRATEPHEAARLLGCSGKEMLQRVWLSQGTIGLV